MYKSANEKTNEKKFKTNKVGKAKEPVLFY